MRGKYQRRQENNRKEKGLESCERIEMVQDEEVASLSLSYLRLVPGLVVLPASLACIQPRGDSESP